MEFKGQGPEMVNVAVRFHAHLPTRHRTTRATCRRHPTTASDAAAHRRPTAPATRASAHLTAGDGRGSSGFSETLVMSVLPYDFSESGAAVGLAAG